jgi:glycerate 2-kinase
MKVLICPDAFKGTMSASRAAKAIEEGIKKASSTVQTRSIPMTDGGHGALESVRACTDSKTIKKCVRGPFGEKVIAEYLIFNDNKRSTRKAFIEIAQASGITLIQKEDLNPLYTTSYGVGELITDALNNGCREIVLGLGGSGTNDGGMGMAQALGVRFLDEEEHEITFRKDWGYSGGSLKYVEKLDTTSIHPDIANTKFLIVSDVNNPLVGDSGATQVYGPQKGAQPELIKELDRYLERYAKVIQKELDINVLNIPGAGAAGGLAAGLLAFTRADIVSGINWYMQLSQLNEVVKDCDLVITGEGKIDHQTTHGKTTQGVAKMANLNHVPVIALGGCLGKGYDSLTSLGIKVVYDVSKGKSYDDEFLKKEAFKLLKEGAEKAFIAYLNWKN